MLIPILVAALMAPASPSAPVAAPSVAAPTVAAAPTSSLVVGHGKLNWFEGSYEDALARAASENKIVFINFWTEW